MSVKAHELQACTHTIPLLFYSLTVLLFDLSFHLSPKTEGLKRGSTLFGSLPLFFCDKLDATGVDKEAQREGQQKDFERWLIGSLARSFCLLLVFKNFKH